MTVPLPFSPLPGADHPGSLAESQQANNEALAEAVAPAAPFKVGSATVTWPGGSTFSNVSTVPHEYASVTSAIATGDLPSGAFVFEMAVANIAASGGTAVDFRAHTTDGALPVAATTRTFYYLIAD